LTIGIKTESDTLCMRAPGPAFLSTLFREHCVFFVVQKKLPFAGYSVVKDQDRGVAASVQTLSAHLCRTLTAFTASVRSLRVLRSLARQP
jgi:hypothetical protein